MGSLEGPTGPPEEEFSIANVIRLKSSGTWPLYNFSTFQVPGGKDMVSAVTRGFRMIRAVYTLLS